jgi:7tm Chemosensory receptor
LKKMETFESEKQLHSTFRFFEFVGLQYFSLKKLTDKNVSEKPSKLRALQMFLSIFLLILTWCLLEEFSAESNDFEKVMRENIMNLAIEILQDVLVFLSILTTFGHAYTTTTKMKSLFMNLREISRQFLTMNVVLNFDRVKQSVWKIFSVMTLGLIVQYSFLAYFDPRNTPRSFLSFYYNFVSILSVMKFVLFVAIINLLLRELLHVLSSFNQIELINESSCFELSTKRSLEKRTRLIKQLKAARKVYTNIQENVSLVISINGRTVFLFIVLMITTIIWSAYICFLMIKGVILVRWGYVVFLFVTFCEVALPIAYCQETLNLVKKIHPSTTSY